MNDYGDWGARSISEFLLTIFPQWEKSVSAFLLAIDPPVQEVDDLNFFVRPGFESSKNFKSFNA